VGGSFTEVGSVFSHILNQLTSTLIVPIPTTISNDPRITNQFLSQK